MVMAEFTTDPLTKSTLVALIARWQRSYYETTKYRKIRDDADQKLNEFNNLIEQCREMCKSMGFDPEAKDIWLPMIRACGGEAAELYNQSRGDLPLWEFRTKTIEHDDKPQEIKERPPIKDICVDRLTFAGKAGLKANDIREFIQNTYPGEIHEKTVGMTLYRLLQDKRITREGHKWFIVAPKAQTVNPGADTPGSNK